jgi:hypothetical protein
MKASIIIGLSSFFVSLACLALTNWIYKLDKIIASLFCYFFVIPIICYSGAYLITVSTFETLLPSYLLHMSLSAAAIQTYPALREEIPTIALLRFINNSPSLTREKIIEKFLNTSNLHDQKIEDLLNDSLIVYVDGRMKLTRFGINLCRIFRIYRKILGTKRCSG